MYYVIPKKRGRSDTPNNLRLLHKTCYKQITLSKNESLRAIWRKNGIID
nr:hypothetical protein [Haslea karadagensis]